MQLPGWHLKRQAGRARPYFGSLKTIPDLPTTIQANLLTNQLGARGVAAKLQSAAWSPPARANGKTVSRHALCPPPAPASGWPRVQEERTLATSSPSQWESSQQARMLISSGPSQWHSSHQARTLASSGPSQWDSSQQAYMLATSGPSQWEGSQCSRQQGPHSQANDCVTETNGCF